MLNSWQQMTIIKIRRTKMLFALMFLCTVERTHTHMLRNAVHHLTIRSNLPHSHSILTQITRLNCHVCVNKNSIPCVMWWLNEHQGDIEFSLPIYCRCFFLYAIAHTASRTQRSWCIVIFSRFITLVWISVVVIVVIFIVTRQHGERQAVDWNENEIAIEY